MKKLFLLIFGFLFSFNIFGQISEKELIINNNTETEYIGFYYLPLEQNKDPYLDQAGEIHSEYKYKYFIVKKDGFDKIFNKEYVAKIYKVKDSTYYELIKIKLDCSKITIDMYENYYQIIYKRYNGETREQRQYILKKY